MRLNNATSCSLYLMLAIAAVFPRSEGSDTSMAPLQQKTPEENQWLAENYGMVKGIILPSGVIPSGEFPHDTRFIVTVRISPTWGEGHRRLSLSLKYSGQVRASATAPAIGSSIQSQLLSLHRENSSSPAKELAQLVKVNSWEFDLSKAPELSALARRFEQIQMSPVLPDVLMMDATGYEFWTQSLYGAQVEVAMTGPGPEAKKQPHPLLEWAEEFRRLADKYRTR